MEGRPITPERPVVRRYEGNRQEEELCELVYEQIWPLVRNWLNRQRDVHRHAEPEPHELSRGA